MQSSYQHSVYQIHKVDTYRQQWLYLFFSTCGHIEQCLEIGRDICVSHNCMSLCLYDFMNVQNIAIYSFF